MDGSRGRRHGSSYGFLQWFCQNQQIEWSIPPDKGSTLWTEWEVHHGFYAGVGVQYRRARYEARCVPILRREEVEYNDVRDWLWLVPFSLPTIRPCVCLALFVRGVCYFILPKVGLLCYTILGLLWTGESERS